MKFLVLTTLDNSIDAHILRTKLESEGIPCFLNNENITNLTPHLYKILGFGVQIFVPEDRLKEAKDIAGIDEGSIKCPNCKSSNITNRLLTGWNKIALTLLSLISAAPIGNLLNQYVCYDCNTEFKSNTI